MLANIVDIRMDKPLVGIQINCIQEYPQGHSLAKPRGRCGPNEQDKWFALDLEDDAFGVRGFATDGTWLTIGQWYEPHEKHKTQ